MFAEPPEPEPTAPDRQSRLWQVRDLVLGLVLILGAFLVVVVALGVVAAVTDTVEDSGDTDALGVIGTLIFELLIGASVVLLAIRRGIEPAQLGFVRPQRWGPLVTAWFGSYAVLVAYSILLAVLDGIGIDVSSFDEGNPIPVDSDESVVLLAVLGIAVVAVAPFSEELFFRGLMFRGMRGYWRFLPSLLVSGLLFGAFHANPSVILPFTFIGALFAWAYEKSRSLWTAIIAHALINGVSFILTVAGAGS